MPNAIEGKWRCWGGFHLFLLVGRLFLPFSKLMFWSDINEKDVIKIRVKNAVFEYVLSFHLLTA